MNTSNKTVWRWFIIAHVVVNLFVYFYHMFLLSHPLGKSIENILIQFLFFWIAGNVAAAIVIIIRKARAVLLILPVLTLSTLTFLFYGNVFSIPNIIDLAVSAFLLLRGGYSTEKVNNLQNIQTTSVTSPSSKLPQVFMIIGLFMLFIFLIQSVFMHLTIKSIDSDPQDLNSQINHAQDTSEDSMMQSNDGQTQKSTSSASQEAEFKADVAGLFVETNQECALRDISQEYIAQQKALRTHIASIEIVSQSCGPTEEKSFSLNVSPKANILCNATVSQIRPNYIDCILR